VLPTTVTDNTRRQLPAIYSKAKLALRQCREIPDCLEYEARAEGMERYAQKMRDGELLKTAFRVRAWAIRRCGELLTDEPPGTGAHLKRATSRPLSKGRKALAKRHEISGWQQKRAQRFAAIPLKMFTELVEDQNLPTMEGLEILGKIQLRYQHQRNLKKALTEEYEDSEIAKRYTVLLADPPWRYEHPPMGASNRSIENQYPTLDLDGICAIRVGTNAVPVSELADENAVLFLWATAPKLSECFHVITAWGFVYRTCMVWVKDKIGMGYHVRNQHEILLIAKRGELAPPKPENRPSSVVRAARGKHSEKPPAFIKLIEHMYPNVRNKIELFSRIPRKGWDHWGLEAKNEELLVAAE
jgi:N6-adenosine-specific RNA methylase IME4